MNSRPIARPRNFLSVTFVTDTDGHPRFASTRITNHSLLSQPPISSRIDASIFRARRQKLMKKIMVAVLGLGLGCSIAFGDGAQKKAQSKSLHDQFTGQQYGMAGCGLG